MGVYKYCINNDLYNLVKKLKFEYEWRYYNLFELLSNINNKEARNDKFPKENRIIPVPNSFPIPNLRIFSCLLQCKYPIKYWIITVEYKID